MRASYWLLGISALLLISLNSCKKSRTDSADLYTALPRKTVMLLHFNRADRALESLRQNRIYEALQPTPVVSNFEDELQHLQEILEADSLQNFLHKRPVLVAVALSGAEKYAPLVIVPGDRTFERQLGRAFNAHYQTQKREYAGVPVFRFFREDGREYHVASHRKLLLFSPSQNLLEEAVRQLQAENPGPLDSDFARLRETSNRKDPLNLYLNLQELPEWVNMLLPRGEAGFLKRLGSWSELDLQIHNREILMSGLSLFPEDGPYYPQVFTQMSPRASSGQDIVPAQSALWLSITFDQAEQYYRAYCKYLQASGRLKMHQQLLEKLPYPAEEMLLPWLDNEMGLFVPSAKESVVKTVGYFKVRQPDVARSALDSLADPDFVEGYRGTLIKKMTGENAHARLLGPLFKDFHFPYFALQNDYLLLAEDLPALKGSISDILDGKTLGRSEDYRQFAGRLPGRSHLKVVVSNPGLLRLLATRLDPADGQSLSQNIESLQPLRWAALQLNVEKDAAFTNFYLLHQEHEAEKVTRVWTTQLESEVRQEPQFLKNHVNGKYDIAVQDHDHRLYLVDYEGNILWTRQLDGPIMGSIVQVDAYRNNKLQMLLNTENKLYLIDRLGRDVEQFPVSLPQSATAPAAVLDYDQNRKYRILVPAGGKLLNYNIEGQPVKGWKAGETESPIISRPQHFSVKGKDIIAAQTEKGRLLMLNRRGEVRYASPKALPVFQGPLYLRPGDNLDRSELMGIDQSGAMWTLRPDGTTDQVQLEPGAPADHFRYFDDKYIFSSGRRLFVKTTDNPWQVELEGDITHEPRPMIFRNDFYLAAYSRPAEEIRLYNKKGELVEGFPVFAQGGFDMGSLKLDAAINVVTSSDDGSLICYRVE